LISAIQLQHERLEQTALFEPVLVGESDTPEHIVKPLVTATSTAQTLQVQKTDVQDHTIPETEVLKIQQSHSKKVKPISMEESLSAWFFPLKT